MEQSSINKKIIRDNLENRIINFLELFQEDPQSNKISSFIKEIIKAKTNLIGNHFDKEEVEEVIRDLFVDYDDTDTYKEKNFDKFLENLFAEDMSFSVGRVEKYFANFIGQKEINKSSISKLIKILENSIKKEISTKNAHFSKKQNSLIKFTTNSHTQELSALVETYLNIKGEEIKEEESFRGVFEKLDSCLIGPKKFDFDDEKITYHASRQHAPDGLYYVNDNFILVESTLKNTIDKDSSANIRHFVSTLYLAEIVRKEFEKNKIQYFLIENVTRYKQILNNEEVAKEMISNPKKYLEAHINSNKIFDDLFCHATSVGTDNYITTESDKNYREYQPRLDKYSDDYKRKNSGSTIILPVEVEQKKESDYLVYKYTKELIEKIKENKRPIKYYANDNDGPLVCKVPISFLEKERLIKMIKDVGKEKLKESVERKAKIENDAKKDINKKLALRDFKLSSKIINNNMARLLGAPHLENEKALINFYAISNQNPNKILTDLGIIDEDYNMYEKEEGLSLARIEKELGVSMFYKYKTYGVKTNSEINRFGSEKYTNEEFRAGMYGMASAYSLAGVNSFGDYSADILFTNELYKIIAKNTITDVHFATKGRRTKGSSDEDNWEQKIRPEVIQKPRGLMKELFSNVLFEKDRVNFKNMVAETIDGEKNENKEPDNVINNLIKIKSGLINSLLVEMETLQQSEGVKDPKELSKLLSRKFMYELTNMGIVIEPTFEDVIRDDLKMIRDPECVLATSELNNGIMRLAEGVGIELEQESKIKRKKRP